MFIVGFEEGIDETEENPCKYQSGKEYLDHDRTETLKSCPFYSKHLYRMIFPPIWSHTPTRNNNIENHIGQYPGNFCSIII